MKWKRLFNFLVLAVCALAGVAAVQWYSQQPAVTTYENSDVLVVERAIPHGLKSTTLTNLRTYMQTGTLLSADGSVDRTNLADNTKVIFNPNQFGTNGSGPFNVFIRSNVFLTNPMVASGFISGNGSGLTNVHMTNVVDDTGTPLFSQSGDELTLSWFGGQETIVFSAGGDMVTLAPNVTINTNLIVLGNIYGSAGGISNVAWAAITNAPNAATNTFAGITNALGYQPGTNGAGSSSLPTAPVTLATLASMMSSNTFWESGDSVIVKQAFRTTEAPLSVASGSGGSAAVADGNYMRLGNMPTNTSSYGTCRYSSSSVPWRSNFVFDTGLYLAGVQLSEFSFGLASAYSTTLAQADRVQWIANTNWSDNWIAMCSRDSTISAWTSSIPMTVNLTNRFSIYAPTTNTVYFYTNGVIACEISDNIPGSKSLAVGARSIATANTGTAVAQYMFLDFWWSLVQ